MFIICASDGTESISIISSSEWVLSTELTGGLPEFQLTVILSTTTLRPVTVESMIRFQSSYKRTCVPEDPL